MSNEFVEYVLELLEPSGGITKARMFGGYVVRKFGVAIALIFEDEIYFKVDENNIDDYKKLNSRPFTYEKHGKIVTISNWVLPIEILEDEEKLMQFTEKSYQAALKKKKPRKSVKDLSQPIWSTQK